jgi:hypothetical protein
MVGTVEIPLSFQSVLYEGSTSARVTVHKLNDLCDEELQNQDHLILNHLIRKSDFVSDVRGGQTKPAEKGAARKTRTESRLHVEFRADLFCPLNERGEP